jgi:hypothetical protein
MTTHNDDDDDENGRLAITVSCPICVAKIGQTCVILSADRNTSFMRNDWTKHSGQHGYDGMHAAPEGSRA